MLLCQIISLHGQIVVLVDKGNIQPGGTGVTVLAVDAASGGNDLCLRLCADDGGAYADDADLFPAWGRMRYFPYTASYSFNSWGLYTRRSSAKIRSLNSPTDRSRSTSR